MPGVDGNFALTFTLERTNVGSEGSVPGPQIGRGDDQEMLAAIPAARPAAPVVWSALWPRSRVQWSDAVLF